MVKVAKEASDAAELLVEAYHEHKRTFQACAKEMELTQQQAVTLLYVPTEGEGLSMSALAEVLMCDASNVTGIVDKLETRSLIKRGQAEDRRVKVLKLTPEGEAMRDAIKARMTYPPTWLLSLSRDDQRTLRDVLKRAFDKKNDG